MLRPVGSQSPSVYWRRRLLTFASVVLLLLLIALTARAVLSGGPASGKTAASGSSPPASPTPQPTTQPTPHPTPSTNTLASAAKTTTPGATSGHPTPVAPLPCTPAHRVVVALTEKSNFAVGSNPVLMMQVTNTGSLPCVQNLADSQVELRVYNGESRVWGSHDCKIQPGTDDRTLAVRQPVLISLVWSGLSSQPKCAGTRQRVGAGTYTLYAKLAGHEGHAAQFSIS